VLPNLIAISAARYVGQHMAARKSTHGNAGNCLWMSKISTMLKYFSGVLRGTHECNSQVARDADAFPLSDSQRAELDWRIADDDTNPSDVVPWDEAKGLARALFAK